MDNITSPGPILRFFMTVVEENAGRASRSEPSLTYDECCIRWSICNRATYGISVGVDAPKKRNREETQEMAAMTSAVKTLTRTIGSISKGGSTGNIKTKKKKGGFCKWFNKEGGCNNAQSTDGCVGQDGTNYIHACNVKMAPGNKTCSARDHATKDHQ